ncbi:hypothetical protein A4X03_0g4942, partial [Tilletia caries]
MQVVQIAFPILFLALLGSVQAANDPVTQQCVDQANVACRPGQDMPKTKIRVTDIWSCLCRSSNIITAVPKRHSGNK